MALGDIVLFTSRYTAGDVASKRKLYPVKVKYKQTQNTKTPTFPSSYTIYSNQEYWFPYSGVTPTDLEYIPYTSGDEYTWTDTLELRPPELVFPNPNLRKYKDVEEGRRVVYANEIYVSTLYFFKWANTKFSENLNPYTSNNIRKWRKLSDTSETWTQYWYHPLLRRFYPLAEIDELQELPDFDEPEQSKWDSFIGDASDLNIENFTLAQIRELISSGLPQSTAEALVDSIDTAVITANTVGAGGSTPTSLAVNPSTSTVTVNVGSSNSSQGLEGEDADQPPNSPSMYQRFVDPETGYKSGIDQYFFNLRPNNVSYTNIGANWTEIERVNNFPLVDYRNQKLMKISFEFVVEAHSGGTSSIYESCEERLKQLRRMASRPERVQFTNFDSLFGDKVILSEFGQNAHEFAIVDMSINSVQRTRGDGNSFVGEISRATVSITLQEVRINNDEIIFMPKIKGASNNGGGGGGGGGDPSLCIPPILYSQTAITVKRNEACSPEAT